MLGGPHKKFRLKCYNVAQNDEEEKTEIMHANKDCNWHYYCYNRAEMTVNWTEDSNNQLYLGKVYWPFDLCRFRFHVYSEEKDAIDYTVHGNILQAYFWCRCPCDMCNEILFEVYKGETHEGTQVG